MNQRYNFFNPNSYMSQGFQKPGFDWSNFLNNTQKTIGIINQGIPIFYQLKPIWSNAKTAIRVMNEVNRMNKSSGRVEPAANTNTNINTSATNNTNNPVFFQ